MALNQPIVDEFEIDGIINYRLDELVRQINREGFHIEKSGIQYTFFDRCEFLWIDSGKLYPNEDLPSKFGVYRGYSGGGVHGGLRQTEVSRMTARRIAKAERLLEYFRQIFLSVLEDTDRATERNTGESLEIWESTSL